MRGCAVGLLGRIERGGDGSVQDGGVDVRHLDFHVHDRVFQDDLLVGEVGGPGDDVDGRLVIGLHPVLIGGADDDGVHAEILRLGGRILADEDGVVLLVHTHLAAARKGLLHVGEDVRLDVGKAVPGDGRPVILEPHPEREVRAGATVG